MNSPVPAVHLELDREVQRLVLAPRELAVHAERDSERAARATLKLEARVLALLAEGPDLAQAAGGDEQARSRVPHAEGPEALELAGELHPDPVAAYADERVEALEA